MILSTTPQIEGHPIREYKGVVTGEVIIGAKFDAFQAVNSDKQKREKLRVDVLTTYVKKHGLTATMYQDYGWPAKKFGD